MIDEKIIKLRGVTSNFIYIEYYSHEQSDCWKIDNEFSAYSKDKFVLCRFDEGIEKALDLAIKYLGAFKSQL
jgi:hypothetical protein